MSYYYHGSNKIVASPIFGAGNPKNDYGLGFYCTEHPELAKEWASSEGNDGFVNKYHLEWQGLSVLHLNHAPFNILNWLAILLKNRSFDLKAPLSVQAKNYMLDHFLPAYQEADVMIGYRADDSYFSFSKTFLDNTISIEQLKRAMHLGKLGEQVVFKSQEAIGRLVFDEVIPVDSHTYYPLRLSRDRNARDEFTRILAETPTTDAHYMIDILREKWENDDPRLF